MTSGETVAPPAGPGPTRRIGEVAALLDMSERTLRYYEEIGLITPSAHTPGGTRRYSDDDIARVRRIKEFRDLMGFDLDEIRAILGNEDRLAALREEYRSGHPAPARRHQLLVEGLELQAALRAQVEGKVQRLQAFLAELDARIERTRELAGLAEEQSSRR